MLGSGSTERRSDEDLLAAIARRDPDACSVFYRRHLPRAVAYVMGQTHDPEVTADIVGEVFAAVIASAGRYRPERDSAAPWVMGIARNVISASRRRGRVEDRTRRRLGIETLELDEADVHETEAMASLPGGGVVELVEALPDGERAAVKARIVDELGYREIAAELRCSELVARKRVSRGLGRLRKQLEES
jgi:RNA polymerase sigma factor (sigma-70 family)